MRKILAILLIVALCAILANSMGIEFREIQITSESWPGDEKGFSLGNDSCYFGVQAGVFEKIYHFEWFGFCGSDQNSSAVNS